MKLSPFELYLRTMMVGPGKTCTLWKDEAYARIKKLTRQDFGFDFHAWRERAATNPEVSEDDKTKDCHD